VQYRPVSFSQYTKMDAIEQQLRDLLTGELQARYMNTAREHDFIVPETVCIDGESATIRYCTPAEAYAIGYTDALVQQEYNI
jgi:hypothetical protein